MENKENKEVLLSVQHLCQYFKLGKRELKAVDDVSFDVYKGEVFGLVGESGCGKTTTGRTIIKLYNATSGDVYFKGNRICAGVRKQKEDIKSLRIANKQLLKDIKENPKLSDEEKQRQIESANAELKAKINELQKSIEQARYDHKNCDKEYAHKQIEKLNEEYKVLLAKVQGDEEKTKQLKQELSQKIKIAKKTKLITQIQMIFQDPIASLNPRMTVQEIISEGLIIQGIRDKKYLCEKTYEILEMVGLVKEHASRYPHEFSGGQRQRIGIARSVIMNPEMIIADEPISALDVSIQAQVINLLNDLRKELGLTILFIAHDLSVVKYFSDRIGVMYFGKLVELASSEELFAHPMHPYTKSLLSAIPLPDPVYEKKRVRITYNPLFEHDYREDKPSLKEIRPNHFVYCNSKEEEKYRKELNIEK